MRNIIDNKSYESLKNRFHWLQVQVQIQLSIQRLLSDGTPAIIVPPPPISLPTVRNPPQSPPTPCSPHQNLPFHLLLQLAHPILHRNPPHLQRLQPLIGSFTGRAETRQLHIPVCPQGLFCYLFFHVGRRENGSWVGCQVWVLIGFVRR